MLAAEANASADEARSAPRLRCVLVCDLADSTALIERLGDAQASLVLREHDRIARQALVRHHGQEIDKTDGFLALFQRPIEAVAFALDYQQRLRKLGEDNGISLRTRVGIHVGELLSWRNTPEDIVGGAKPVEVEGLAKAIAARLMSLADPGQVLLSESAYSLALRARNELDAGWNPRWKEHGRYRLHGVDSPLPVFEVSAHGAAPHPPRDKIKAKRIRPWYRWPPVYAVLALALIAAPLWYALKPAPAIAFIERDWIVVGDVRNLSDDPRLDAPLDYALRLGLEQSRHVNIVSRARMREALANMDVDLDSAVDRDRGSELALRIGARAVLVPTVHQSAGRLRFTAELIDPNTRTTVYSHFHDALEGDELLGAMDTVLRDVRVDLGESLAAIDASGPALPKVTSPNLEAVRALVAGIQAKREQRYDASMALVEEALRLDPEFAMAYLHRASLNMITRRYAEADEDLRRAAAQVDRLSQRERLFIEATRAAQGSTAKMLGAWRAFADLYPDDSRARYNLALFSTEYANDCAAALNELPPRPQETVTEKGLRLYETARCHLLSGELSQADAVFAEANASGLIGNGVEYALLRAIQGNVEAAKAVLSLRDDSRPQAEKEAADLARITLALHHGDVPGAAAYLDTLLDDAKNWPPTGRSLANVVALQLDAYRAERDWEPRAERTLEELLGMARGALQQEARSLLDHAGALAWLLSRRAASPPAQLLDAWASAASAMEARPLRDLAATILAESLLRSGEAARAVQSLQGHHSEAAPFMLVATLARAQAASGNHLAATEICQWLQRHSGRAMAERAMGGALHPSNLIERAALAAQLASSTDAACRATAEQEALLTMLAAIPSLAATARRD